MTGIDFDWAYHNPHLWKCSQAEAHHNHKNSECVLTHYGTPWPPGDPAEWPFWTDGIGQQFQAGDLLAVSTISGRSPQLVVAECVRINRRRNNGELIMNRHHAGYETPDGNLPHGMDYHSPNRPKIVRTSGCTVTAKPFFTRFGPVEPYLGNPVRNSIYQFVENIVRLDQNAANIVRARIAGAAAAAALAASI